MSKSKTHKFVAQKEGGSVGNQVLLSWATLV